MKNILFKNSKGWEAIEEEWSLFSKSEIRISSRTMNGNSESDNEWSETEILSNK